MNPRRIVAAAGGATFFSAVYLAGAALVPGPMEPLPLVAGLVCPPGVALLWLLLMTTYDGDDAVVTPYVPPAQRRTVEPSRRKELAR